MSLKRSIYLLAPNRLVVIGVVDPEISKIGNPGDIETTGESAGDDEPCVRRGTGEYDIGLPLLDQPLASRKRGLDPLPEGNLNRRLSWVHDVIDWVGGY